MKEEIHNELNKIAPALAKLPRKNAFDVPAMYFNTLPDKVLAAALAEEAAQTEPELSPLLQQLRNSKAMTMPEGYFAKSAASVIQKIRKQEVKEEVVALAPALAAIKKSTPFEVPANYFAALPNRIIAKATQEERSQIPTAGWLDGLNTVIDRLLAPLFTPRLTMAFATAFVVGVIFWFGDQQHNVSTNAEAALASELQAVNSEEVQGWIAMNIDEFDENSLSKRVDVKKSLLIIDESILNDKSLEQELINELDEEFILNNLEPV